MDEVWKDISLSNLGTDHPASALVSVRHRSAASFENFMAVAFKDGTSPTHLSLRSPAPKRPADHPPPLPPPPDDQRRWNKMIKNRESAARSRARKQATLNFPFLLISPPLSFSPPLSIFSSLSRLTPMNSRGRSIISFRKTPSSNRSRKS